jgi:hypothetical protein
MSERMENNAEDYIIRVRPGLNFPPGDAEAIWDGTVSVDILWSEENPLADGEFGQVMNLTQMICASVPIMESDENVAKLLSDYVDDVYNSMLRDKSVGVTGVVGNVVQVNFKTKSEVTDG